MKTREQIVFEILGIYPKLIEAEGFVFFGTLEEKPPYEICTYSSWRLTLDVNPEYKMAMKTIGLLLDSLLENVRVLSPRPHGYIKIENSVVSFHWVTKDIVDTMLDNIEKMSKLDHYKMLY